MSFLQKKYSLPSARKLLKRANRCGKSASNGAVRVRGLHLADRQRPHKRIADGTRNSLAPEIRADVDYSYDFNHPKRQYDQRVERSFPANEVQVTQLGVGGDFHYDNVRARLMTQFGLYSQTTRAMTASPSRGQWNLDNAYRYVLGSVRRATTSTRCMESM